MKYAREVIDVMAAFPERHFKMQQLVAIAMRGGNITSAQKKSARKAIMRILEVLRKSGHVHIEPAASQGSYALYIWKKTAP